MGINLYIIFCSRGQIGNSYNIIRYRLGRMFMEIYAISGNQHLGIDGMFRIVCTTPEFHRSPGSIHIVIRYSCGNTVAYHRIYFGVMIIIRIRTYKHVIFIGRYGYRHPITCGFAL